MVKTRHSVDVDETPPAQFISLRRRSTRSSQKFEQADFSSGDSDDGDYIPRKPIRNCGGSPRTASSKRSSKRRRVLEDDSADEACLPWAETPPGLLEEHGGRNRSRNSSLVNMNGEAESYGMIRRSTRNRTSLYDSLNQSLIIDNAALGLVDVEEDMPGPSMEPALQRRLRPQTREVKPAYPGQEGYGDMYSRIKRRRRQVKRDMYGIPLLDQGGETEGSDTEHSSNNDEQADNEQEEGEEEQAEQEDDEDDDDDEEDAIPQRRSYFLREHKPRTQIYEAPPIGPQMRRSARNQSIFQDSPPRPMQCKTRDHPAAVYRSPARRNSIRRKAAFHGSSSTSSSDSSSSSDEGRFERRKSKSMAKARNRCLPMNLDPEDMSSGLRKERARIGSSLADVDPMTIDRSVTFETVGGLEKHVRALKEMVVFPLLYPEVFEKFKISPPRGVLFYGPPGTGKTLVARALANECSRDDKRVAFFMRKGADCLSKWVGESERQLRLLFDQAYQMRPAIIFFDEIDGLAPVRSSRQDQIHSSIVSTLLALMDGLDSRGEIVIIGATNRIDSIDPALRRPGRFDREFLFPLPSIEARQQILKIHTRAWTPKLADPFLGEVAERCVGYCGADVKALCTEAALLALRRRYPQIYTSSDKLQLDVSTINVSAKDFHNAMQVIVPTAQRSMTSPARSLSPTIRPLLRAVLDEVLNLLQAAFPSHIAKLAGVDKPGASNSSSASGELDSAKLEEGLCSDDDDHAPSIFEITPSKNCKRNSGDHPQGTYMSFSNAANKCPVTHRPRLMLSGASGQGQTAHLAPAILYHLERLPVHVLDLPALFANSSKTPEEACAQIFREARRTAPCILYMPHISQWWSVINETLQATFLTLVQDLDPSAPVLMLATSDLSYLQLHDSIQELFDNRYGEVVTMRNPNTQERRDYFSDLIRRQSVIPPARKKQAALRALEVLPKAPPPEPRELTQEEQRKLKAQEEATNRELRIFLRDALNKIARDRKFNIFAKPVDIEEVPDYYEIITKPMDLHTMMSKIDLHHYQTMTEFVADIDQICSNALEYNPDKAPGDRAIRHRACALRDMAYSIVKNELDPDFDKVCEEMAAARKKRGVVPLKAVPDFYFTKPLQKPGSQAFGQLPTECSSRFSKRARGMDAPEIEKPEVKKIRNSEDQSSQKSSNENTVEHQKGPKNKLSPSMVKGKPISSSKRIYKKPKKCIWSYRSRKRRRMTPFTIRRRSFGQMGRKSPPVKVDIEEVESSAKSADDEEDEEIVFVKPAHTVTTEEDQNDYAGDSSDTLIDEPSAPVHNEPMDTEEEESKDAEVSPSSEGCDEDTQEMKSPSNDSSNEKTSISPTKTDAHFTNLKLLSQEASSSTTVALIDSGIGSSVESNCESMDSVDQMKQQSSTACVTTAEETAQEEDKQADTPENCDGQESAKNMGDNSEGISPSFRMTRSRMQSKEVQRAVEILEEPEPTLIVDQQRLEALLNTVVQRTHDYTIDRLGKLYSMISRCIFQHRLDYDKTMLIADMESAVNRYTSSPVKLHPTPSSHSVAVDHHTPSPAKGHLTPSSRTAALDRHTPSPAKGHLTPSSRTAAANRHTPSPAKGHMTSSHVHAAAH